MNSSNPGKKNNDNGTGKTASIEVLLGRLMGLKNLPALLDILPFVISIATDVSCKEIRHNLVAAKFLSPGSVASDHAGFDAQESGRRNLQAQLRVFVRTRELTAANRS